MLRIRFVVVAGVVMSSPFAALTEAQEKKATIEFREKWSNVMAETKVDFHLTINSPQPFKGRVVWTFADALTKRVFPRGRNEIAVAIDANKPALVKISLDAPPLNAGIARQGHLVVAVLSDAKGGQEATLEKVIWILASHPFANQTKWLQSLKITLFDTDPKSKTAEALRSLKVPFAEVRNPAAVRDLKDGLLLVGEGTSFKEEAGLAEALVRGASRGLAVLCLAPSIGAFPLPGTDQDSPAPGSLVLRRQDIISKFDKRLDAYAWAPDNQVIVSSLEIKAEEGKIVAHVQPAAKGWPWLQIDYPEKRGRLIICGFGIIRNWQSSPTPRFLLARLFEQATELPMNDFKK
jgi:hypothetical protein